MESRTILSCASCRAATAEVQRASLEAAAGWFSEIADRRERLEKESGWLSSAPALSLCRAQPDCDGLVCEAPMRRGVSVFDGANEERYFRPAPRDSEWRSTATASIQRHVGAASAYSPPPDARLEALVARYFLARVALDATRPPILGPAAISALLIANNLVIHLHPGKRCPSVSQVSVAGSGVLAQATDLSLEELGQRISAGENESSPLASGDLAAIHLLVGAVNLVAATERRRSTASVAPEKRGCLSMLLFWKTVPPPPAPVEDPHSAERAQLRQQFAALDLLGHAATLFAGTSANDLPVAAGVLRQLAASDDGYLALNLITKEAARGAIASGDASRLARVGLALLEDDRHAHGLVVAGWLLAELLAAFPHARPRSGAAEADGTEGSVESPDTEGHRGEGSSLWSLICGSLEEGWDAPFPQWLGRVLLAGAEWSRQGREWTNTEGRLMGQIRDVGEALLGCPTLADPYWHLFYVRTVACMALQKLSHFRLPNKGTWDLHQLCRRIEEIHSASADAGENELQRGVRDEARKVMDLPAFERSFRAAARRRRTRLRHTINERTVLDDYLEQWVPPEERDSPPGEDPPPAGVRPRPTGGAGPTKPPPAPPQSKPPEKTAPPKESFLSKSKLQPKTKPWRRPSRPPGPGNRGQN